jgi:hypothetical protein
VIRTEGQDLEAVFLGIRHHAKHLEPIALELLKELVFGWPGRDEEVHLIVQSRNGPNSVAWFTPDGQQFHFRWHHRGDSVIVFDRYWHGYDQANVVAVLSTRRDVRHFVRGELRSKKAA